MKENKNIKVMCYGKEHNFKTKEKAMDYFFDCFNCCDPASSEAQRYMSIIAQIRADKKEITDGWN